MESVHEVETEFMFSNYSVLQGEANALSFGGYLATLTCPSPWLETGQGFLFASVGPSSRHLLPLVRSALRRLSPQAGHMLVAVSGGRDSVVLLDLLRQIAATERVRLTVAHVHHGIRGDEADRDRAFVQDLTRSFGLACVSTRVDTPAFGRRHRMGLEEAARTLRYRALERLRRRTSADVIVTAHHADDQAETVFFRATRGSGLKGLAGILPQLNEPPVIRPMLEISGSSIRSYAVERALSFVEDSSNRDLRMRRNLIRHRWLGIASREIGSDLRSSLVRLSRAARSLRETGSRALNEIERTSIVSYGSATLLKADPLAALHRNVRAEIFIRFLARCHIAPTDRLLASIARLIASGTGRWISAGGSGHRIYRERTGLALVRWHSSPLKNTSIHPGVTMTAGNGRLKISSPRRVPRSVRSGPEVAWVDASAASGPLQVRSWRPADRMVPLGMASHKKVSDLLTDGKVPSYRRRSIPIITSGGKIVWVCGVRLDDRFKVTPRTRRVLQFSYHSNV